MSIGMSVSLKLNTRQNILWVNLFREDTAKRIKFLAEFSETSFSQVTGLRSRDFERWCFEQVLKPERSPGRKNGMLAKALQGMAAETLSFLISYINPYNRIMIPSSRKCIWGSICSHFSYPPIWENLDTHLLPIWYPFENHDNHKIWENHITYFIIPNSYEIILIPSWYLHDINCNMREPWYPL